jgi:hypothetical protein
MRTSQTPGPLTHPTGETAHPRRALSAFAALIALSAYLGVAGLTLGFLGLPANLEARLPFASPVLGGLALAVVVALPTSVLAWLAWRGDPRTDTACVAAGLLVVGWILVELAFIRDLSFFHPLYVVVGLVLVRIGTLRR